MCSGSRAIISIPMTPMILKTITAVPQTTGPGRQAARRTSGENSAIRINSNPAIAVT
ncbi:hypothetical protein D3C76_1649920 [compost metagenome]